MIFILQNEKSSQYSKKRDLKLRKRVAPSTMPFLVYYKPKGKYSSSLIIGIALSQGDADKIVSDTRSYESEQGFDQDEIEIMPIELNTNYLIDGNEGPLYLK